jgi:hypothetical protein
MRYYLGGTKQSHVGVVVLRLATIVVGVAAAVSALLPPHQRWITSIAAVAASAISTISTLFRPQETLMRHGATFRALLSAKTRYEAATTGMESIPALEEWNAKFADQIDRITAAEAQEWRLTHKEK